MLVERYLLDDLLVLRPDRKPDARGYFARTYCRTTLGAAGVDFVPTQSSESYNAKAGTLRGLHFQRSPHTEDKIVRCTRGSIFDVVVDVRPDSATFGRWAGIELSDHNGAALFVPQGFAHGFQTLQDETTVYYMIAPDYVPTHAAGVRWDDPAIGIAWPQVSQRIISDRDSSLPPLAQASL